MAGVRRIGASGGRGGTRRRLLGVAMLAAVSVVVTACPAQPPGTDPGDPTVLKPLVLVPPEVTGNPVAGDVLTTSLGEWSGEPSSWTVKWQSCVGGSCADIEGESSTSLVVGASLEGKSVRSVVSASNGGGTSSIGAAETEAVDLAGLAAPVNTSQPTLSWAGGTLDGNVGTWDQPDVSISVEWQRCDFFPGSPPTIHACSAVGEAARELVSEQPISRAVRPDDLPPPGKVATVRLKVTASNTDGIETIAYSTHTGWIAKPRKAVGDIIVANQGGNVGETIFAGSQSWVATGPDAGPLLNESAQWQRCTLDNASCTDIPGATSFAYTVTSADVGFRLRIRITGSNGAGLSEHFSTPLPNDAQGVKPAELPWQGSSNGLIAVDRNGGYATIGFDGGVFNWGGSQFHGSLGGIPLAAKPRAMAMTPSGRGYWIVGYDGGVFTFGDAQYYGSMQDNVFADEWRARYQAGAAVIVAILPLPSGRGYRLVDNRGEIFNYGPDAIATTVYGHLQDGHYGAWTARQAAGEVYVTGAAGHPSRGYWLVDNEGGVFSFGPGGMPFYGSAAGMGYRNVVSMTARPDGSGYWLLRADGSILGSGANGQAFGNVAIHQGPDSTWAWLNAPYRSIASTPSGNGYYIVGCNGVVTAFGDAAFAGHFRFPADPRNSDCLHANANPGGRAPTPTQESPPHEKVFSTTESVTLTAGALGGDIWYRFRVERVDTRQTADKSDDLPTSVIETSWSGNRSVTLQPSDLGDGTYRWTVSAYYALSGEAVDTKSTTPYPRYFDVVTPAAPAHHLSSGPIATNPGDGYRMIDRGGRVYTFGIPGGGWYGDLGNVPLNQPAQAIANTPSGNGYWIVARDGGVFTYGDAPFHGSAAGSLQPGDYIVGIAPTVSGNGYWLLSKDGGVFSFGDAPFHGSRFRQPGDTPFVDIQATPYGGYLLLQENGAINALGPNRFFGSAIRTTNPFSGEQTGVPYPSDKARDMTVTPDGTGWTVVTVNGGVYTLGTARFHGATTAGGTVSGVTASQDGGGYWTATCTGKVEAKGVSTLGQPLGNPYVRDFTFCLGPTTPVVQTPAPFQTFVVGSRMTVRWVGGDDPDGRAVDYRVHVKAANGTVTSFNAGASKSIALAVVWEGQVSLNVESHIRGTEIPSAFSAWHPFSGYRPATLTPTTWEQRFTDDQLDAAWAIADADPGDDMEIHQTGMCFFGRFGDCKSPATRAVQSLMDKYKTLTSGTALFEAVTTGLGCLQHAAEYGAKKYKKSYTDDPAWVEYCVKSAMAVGGMIQGTTLFLGGPVAGFMMEKILGTLFTCVTEAFAAISNALDDHTGETYYYVRNPPGQTICSGQGVWLPDSPPDLTI